MNLSDIAAIFSSVASLAVVGSLIYLALQVRQAERTQQATMRQARAARNLDIFLRLSMPPLSEAFTKGATGDPGLTPEELNQFTLATRAMFYHFEDSFYQHEEGSLNDSAFDSYRRGVTAAFRTPGFRARWRQNGGAYAEEFQAFINAIIAENSLFPPIDLMAEWRAAIAAEIERSKKA